MKANFTIKNGAVCMLYNMPLEPGSAPMYTHANEYLTKYKEEVKREIDKSIPVKDQGAIIREIFRMQQQEPISRPATSTSVLMLRLEEGIVYQIEISGFRLAECSCQTKEGGMMCFICDNKKTAIILLKEDKVEPEPLNDKLELIVSWDSALKEFKKTEDYKQCLAQNVMFVFMKFLRNKYTLIEK